MIAERYPKGFYGTMIIVCLASMLAVIFLRPATVVKMKEKTFVTNSTHLACHQRNGEKVCHRKHLTYTQSVPIKRKVTYDRAQRYQWAAIAFGLCCLGYLGLLINSFRKLKEDPPSEPVS